jgi:hypothetical protein
MKQIVKNYMFYPGDFRRNEKSLEIVEQINQDLKKNPGWSIKLMNYISNGDICTVVYDIQDTNRKLIEKVSGFVQNTEEHQVSLEAESSVGGEDDLVEVS